MAERIRVRHSNRGKRGFRRYSATVSEIKHILTFIALVSWSVRDVMMVDMLNTDAKSKDLVAIKV